MAFSGWKAEALEFFEGLEAENTKPYWERNKETYTTLVRAPMEELLAELEPTFGEGRIFRPYRDVRFSKDKTPYKTSMRAWVAHPSPAGVETGYYVDVGPGGMYAGGGRYHWDRPELDRLRAAVAEFVVEGPKCNLPFFAELLTNAEFISGDYDTGIVARMRG